MFRFVIRSDTTPMIYGLKFVAQKMVNNAAAKLFVIYMNMYEENDSPLV